MFFTPPAARIHSPEFIETGEIRMDWKGWLIGAVAALALLGGCASEPTAMEKVAAPYTPYDGPRIPVVVGDVGNRSVGAPFAGDPAVGVRARTVLLAQLQESQRFQVIERGPDSPLREVKPTGNEFKLRQSEYKLTAEVLDVGRRDAVTGILGGTELRAYVAVVVQVLDTQALRTQDSVHTSRGFAELPTGAAGPDAAQADTLLKLAIRDAVRNLIEAKDRYRWGADLR
jgi:curli biogenesis system outer membrane secretion channel CsgG